MENEYKVGYFQQTENTPDYIIYRSCDGIHKTVYNKKTYDIVYINSAEDRRLLRKEVREEKEDDILSDL